MTHAGLRRTADGSPPDRRAIAQNRQAEAAKYGKGTYATYEHITADTYQRMEIVLDGDGRRVPIARFRLVIAIRL